MQHFYGYLPHKRSVYMVQLSFWIRACAAMVLSIAFLGFGQDQIKPKQLRFQNPDYSKKAYVKSLLIPLGCHYLVKSSDEDILQSSSQLCFEKIGDRVVLSSLKLDENKASDANDVFNMENVAYPIVQFPLNMQSSGSKAAEKFLSLPGARLGTTSIEQNFVFFLHQADSSFQQTLFWQGIEFDETKHADLIDTSSEQSFYESFVAKGLLNDFIASVYLYMLNQLKSGNLEEYTSLSNNIASWSEKSDAELEAFKTSDAHQEHMRFLQDNNTYDVRSLYDFSNQNHLFRRYKAQLLASQTTKHLTMVPVWMINMEDTLNLSSYELFNKKFEMNHPEDLWYMVLAPKL